VQQGGGIKGQRDGRGFDAWAARDGGEESAAIAIEVNRIGGFE